MLSRGCHDLKMSRKHAIATPKIPMFLLSLEVSGCTRVSGVGEILGQTTEYLGAELS